jgi:prepilin-type N-terminal cleavage/methylation domain-containing protein
MSTIRSKGFTLIELLIVVAIISILAAIAVPNFLEAQTRSKVSRTLADMRTLTTAVESYFVDHNKYPPRHAGSDDPEVDTHLFVPDLDTRLEDMRRFTTPIAYITTLPADVFERNVPGPLNRIDYYDEVTTWRAMNYWPLSGGRTRNALLYMLSSVGPDGYIGVTGGGTPGGYPPQPPAAAYTFFDVYDSTNGTVSAGNIFRFQNNAEISTLRD